MRLQLALDVSDIDEAVDFYSKLFDAEPYKRKPGYANFAIENPPLKLVLFENPDNAGGLNHLGVETETSQQVEAAEARLDDSGLDTTGVNDTVCCYAGKTETWVNGPDAERWEWYVKTSDEADFGTDEIAEFKSSTGLVEADAGGACCS
ncbi:MAG: ArsI/CadI family heavy metal resistance metalloenzyme [Actinomycetota bacterium]